MANLPKAKWDIFNYVLESERNLPDDEQTKWKCKPLARADALEVQNLAIGEKAGSAAERAARRSLIGWENLYEDGQPFEFQGRLYPGDKDGLKRATPEELECIPLTWLQEIGFEVIRRAFLTDLEKN